MIETLSTLRVPEGAGQRRDAPPRCRVTNDAFWDTYDTSTLIYDCVYSPDERKLRLYCPKLFNLESLLTQTVFAVDGTQLGGGKWQRSRHLDVVEYSDVAPANELHCAMPTGDRVLAVNTVDRRLDGLNTLYTLSRNNDLMWIGDWARFHVAQHKVEAIVFVDNGSDRYSTDEVADTLKTATNLKKIIVLDAPLRHGPRSHTCTSSGDARFFQTSIMNICLNRFMSRSRAVLSIDVDELVVRKTDVTIFDAASDSRLGLSMFDGRWHYADQRISPVRHATHYLYRDGEAPCPTKYAIRPKGLIARGRQMEVHSLSNVNRRLYPSDKRFYFAHCRQISTNWKSTRQSDSTQDLSEDPLLKSQLSAVFQPSSETT
ncbi:hypothetical protein [Yoonia sp. 2307UL14-13]|uniref:hypothetical protein n=1 Tax=Yoonia sp. 2307UL14-13 TaxID=3126506 RepID=UPI00309DEBF4